MQVSVTMTAQMLILSFLILFVSFPGNLQVHAHVSYDHSFTPKCLTTPLKPQYGGGIAVNPELNHGSKCWTQVGCEKVEIRQGVHGNNFIVASRVANQSAVVQKFQLEADKLYTFSEKGRPVSSATVSIIQTRPYFPFGNMMNQEILDNPKYQDWFTSRFKYYTVFENEMKWAFVNYPGRIANYTSPDDMLNFTKSKGLDVRGHSIHWGNNESLPLYLQKANIDPEYLRTEADAHTCSIVNRYKGQLIHWDVVNENIHNIFFDTILGNKASTHQFQMVHNIDPKPLLFLNEYNTIERSEDGNASAWKYLQKIRKIRKQGYRGPLAIGLQGHFNRVNLPYIRSSIDILESAKLPIWITELDVSNSIAGNVSNVAVYLEKIMKEIHAHRAVKGLMMWSAISKYRPGQNQCYKMCLTDSNFVNLPTGDVVDRMLAEWSHSPEVQGTTNNLGRFKTSLFHGEYQAQIINPVIGKPVKFNLTLDDTPLVVKIFA